MHFWMQGLVFYSYEDTELQNREFRTVAKNRRVNLNVRQIPCADEGIAPNTSSRLSYLRMGT
jgi:hypothetical protein